MLTAFPLGYTALAILWTQQKVAAVPRAACGVSNA